MEQQAEGTRPTVIFCGENPAVALHQPGTQRIVANASYWRCTYSEHGEGNVLVLWVEAGEARVPDVVYADNAPLARFVVGAMVQHFEGFRDRGIADLDPRPARFTQDFGGRRFHRISCHADGVNVEILWRDVRDHQPLRDDNMRGFGVKGDRVYEVSTVICPCADGQIVIDGSPVPGEVRFDATGERPKSSAFLAFCELWMDRGAST